jgi:hypothetical protein
MTTVIKTIREQNTSWAIICKVLDKLDNEVSVQDLSNFNNIHIHWQTWSWKTQLIKNYIKSLDKKCIDKIIYVTTHNELSSNEDKDLWYFWYWEKFLYNIIKTSTSTVKSQSSIDELLDIITYVEEVSKKEVIKLSVIEDNWEEVTMDDWRIYIKKILKNKKYNLNYWKIICIFDECSSLLNWCWCNEEMGKLLFGLAPMEESNVQLIKISQSLNF